jgi:tRNA pseudouridine13 synthase
MQSIGVSTQIEMKIKQTPEEFVVKEILDLKLEEGLYNYYRVTKKNWNTLDLVKEIAKRLHVKLKDIGYAGNKDRIAITTQYISVKKKITFVMKDVKFEFVGTGKERIHLGQLEGNEFIITVRDLDKELKPIKTMINLFGPQRFSTQNATVGKFLITKQFKNACEALELPYEKNDYVGALRKHGLKKLKFYVHAYQSLLWNKLAFVNEKEVLPILGYITEGNDYDEIMKEEGIEKKDFQMRSIREIGSEGTERKRTIEIKDFESISYEEDDLNEGKMKHTVKFFLPKGSYATVAIQSFIRKA